MNLAPLSSLEFSGPPEIFVIVTVNVTLSPARNSSGEAVNLAESSCADACPSQPAVVTKMQAKTASQRCQEKPRKMLLEL
ncbi:hypothetical protein [Neoaquamicrobium sediminum]|uniref:hypothetical protein n=1 Tax=Neoaquamicrobium sediminum TaxID=1849104 RepID=UPI00403791A3